MNQFHTVNPSKPIEGPRGITASSTYIELLFNNCSCSSSNDVNAVNALPTQWAFQIGGDSKSTPIYQVDSYGNVYVTGIYVGTTTIYNLDGTTFKTLELPSSGNLLIVKYNPDGTPSWVTYIGGSFDNGYEISVDSNGNVYVTGDYGGTGTIYNLDGTTFKTLPDSGTSNAFIVKYTTLGVVSWATYIDGNTNNIWLTEIFVDSNGNVYVTGNYNGTATIYNLDGTTFKTLPASGIYTGFIVKYTTLGVASWATYIDGNTYLSGISVDSNGNVYVIGYYEGTATIYSQSEGTVTNYSQSEGTATNYSQSEAPFKTLPDSSSDSNAFIVKYNPDGVPSWATYIDGNTGDIGLSGISVDSNGNVYVIGYYDSGTATIYNANGTPFKTLPDSGTSNAFIVKYTTLGVVSWATYIDGNTYLTGISVDSNGNVYVIGNYNGTAIIYNLDRTPFKILPVSGIYTGIIVIYTTDGDPSWATYIGGNTYLSGISVDSNGNVYVAGEYHGIATIYNANGDAVKTLPDSGTTNSIIVKYTTLGVPSWATYISGNKGYNGYTTMTRISVDSNGNLYVTGNYNGTTTIYNANGDAVKTLPASGDYDYNTFIVKYTTDGALQ